MKRGGRRIGHAAELDGGVRRLRRELPRVAEEILEDDAGERRRRSAPAARPRSPTSTCRDGLRSARSALISRAIFDRSTFDPLNLLPRQPRQLQQVVDEPSHALRGVADAGEVVLAGLVEALAPVLAQRLSEAVDAAQRRAQVVRHGIAERLELAVEQHLFVHGALELEVDRPQLALARCAAAATRAGARDRALPISSRPRDCSRRSRSPSARRSALRSSALTRLAMPVREQPAGGDRADQAAEERDEDDRRDAALQAQQLELLSLHQRVVVPPQRAERALQARHHLFAGAQLLLQAGVARVAAAIASAPTMSLTRSTSFDASVEISWCTARSASCRAASPQAASARRESRVPIPAAAPDTRDRRSGHSRARRLRARPARRAAPATCRGPWTRARGLPSWPPARRRSDTRSRPVAVSTTSGRATTSRPLSPMARSSHQPESEDNRALMSRSRVARSTRARSCSATNGFCSSAASSSRKPAGMAVWLAYPVR